MLKNLKLEMKKFMFDITPRIHNLRHVIYIRWLDYEWIFQKW